MPNLAFCGTILKSFFQKFWEKAFSFLFLGINTQTA